MTHSAVAVFGAPGEHTLWPTLTEITKLKKKSSLLFGSIF